MMKRTTLLLCWMHMVLGYRKCCPANHVVSITSLDRNDPCVSRPKGLDLEPISGTVVSDSVTLSDPESIALPACRTPLELHSLNETELTKTGLLQSSRYRKPFNRTQFCLDRDETGELVALTCDGCQGPVCINLCCPLDHVWVFKKGLGDVSAFFGSDGRSVPFGEMADEEEEELVAGPLGSCEPSTARLPMPRFWDAEKELTGWQEGKQYILRGPPGPKHFFRCAGGPMREDLEFTLFNSGKLQGFHPTVSPHFFTFQRHQFCLNYDSPPGGMGDTATQNFLICEVEDEPGWCMEFRTVYTVAAMSISLIFAFITIIAHLVERTQLSTLFGKITMAFLIHFILAYSAIVHKFTTEYETDTLSCTLLGYFIQYLFLAFFAWMNVMAINLSIVFHNVLDHGKNEKRRFAAFILYAQGLPLVMCAITAIADSQRPQIINKYSLLYPNMGVFSCFLGNSRQEPRPNYFTTPEFIYMQSLQLVLLLVNVVLFVFVIHAILFSRSQMNHAIQQDEKKRRAKENFLIVVKLFFFLVAAWVCDIITSVLEAKLGPDDSCWQRVVLDSFNLFYGVGFFIVLVCSGSMLGVVRAKVHSWSSMVTETFTRSSETNRKSTSATKASSDASEKILHKPK